jgi:hypothetical protein
MKTGLRPRRDILDEPIPDILNSQLQRPIKPVRAVKPVARTSEFKDDTLRTFDPIYTLKNYWLKLLLVVIFLTTFRVTIAPT